MLQTQTERSGRRGSASAPSPAAPAAPGPPRAASPPPASCRPRPVTGVSRCLPAVVSARWPRRPRPAAGPGAGPPPTPRRPRRACKSQSEGHRHGPPLAPPEAAATRLPPPGRGVGPSPGAASSAAVPPGGGGRPRPTHLAPLPEGHAVLPAGPPLSHPRAPNGRAPILLKPGQGSRGSPCQHPPPGPLGGPPDPNAQRSQEVPQRASGFLLELAGPCVSSSPSIA